jgi:glutamyl/glutaminyl-tRNA synthetase
MLLGWAPKDNRELFTVEEFIEVFDLNGMQKSNPTWDYKKMDWFSGMYMRKLTIEEYVEKFIQWIEKYLLTATEEEIQNNFHQKFGVEKTEILINLAKTILQNKDDSNFKTKLTNELKLVQERAVSFFEALSQIEFFYNPVLNVNYDIKQLEKVKDNLQNIKAEILTLISTFPENSNEWKHEDWEAGIRAIGDKYSAKHGDIFMVNRVAVVGEPFSPPLFECMQLLGRDDVVKRLKN